jgi:hypothetical protein
MSKKGNFLQPESTIAEFGIELVVLKSLQNNSEMSHMLFFTLGIDQDVINEDHGKLVQLWHEYGVHQVHEMCRSIGESKRHNQILIQPVPGGQGSLRNVFRADLDLMITRTKIDLGKDFSTGKLIENNVDVGKWIFILDGDSIQKSVINTYPERLIFLLHKQGWTTPKVKNSDKYTLCLGVPSIALSTLLIPWVSSCMAVWRWV